MTFHQDRSLANQVSANPKRKRERQRLLRYAQLGIETVRNAILQVQCFHRVDQLLQQHFCIQS